MGHHLRIGLTGGIASGKSTVSAMLRELGAVVIDADQLAREVVAKGTPGLAAVVEEFGPGLLTPDGDLDRAAKGDQVFYDESAPNRLEAIVHTRVFDTNDDHEKRAPEGAVIVHDIPLLAESGRAAAPDRGGFDAVIVVDAPQDVQVARMVRDRGWTEAEALSRIAAQATAEDRRAIATYLVDNTGSLEDLRAEVEKIYAALTTLR
jgi:dephospho-CoA kinase